MKTLFLEAKYEGKINPEEIPIKKLPKRIGLVTTVQFVDHLNEIKNYLEKNNIKININNDKQKYPGQILGCEQSSGVNIRFSVDAYLYIGDGSFHPIGIASKTKKDVFTFNPQTNEFSKVSKNQIERMKIKRKAQLVKFHSSTEIGVIVSTKPGQNRLDEARKLIKKFPKKNIYFLLFDNIDYMQLENFNFIQSFVNTACPRIEEDIKVINLDELK